MFIGKSRIKWHLNEYICLLHFCKLLGLNDRVNPKPPRIGDRFCIFMRILRLPCVFLEETETTQVLLFCYFVNIHTCISYLLLVIVNFFFCLVLYYPTNQIL